jgi:hypothetical protein
MHKPMTWVYAGPDNGWVDSDKVEFVDIAEGADGRDEMTFEYEGVEYTSNIISGSRPG